jgi:hypothetical protein
MEQRRRLGKLCCANNRPAIKSNSAHAQLNRAIMPANGALEMASLSPVENPAFIAPASITVWDGGGGINHQVGIKALTEAVYEYLRRPRSSPSGGQ